MPLNLPPATTQHPMRTSSLRTLPPPDAAPLQQQQIVTLAHVRYGPRAINEYVDSPRPLPILPLKSTHIGLSSSLPPSPTPAVHGSRHSQSLPWTSHLTTTSSGGVGGGGSVSSGGNGGGGGGGGGDGVVVSTQPSKSPPLVKEEGSNGGGGGVGGAEGDRGGGAESHSSIICTKCGKCRCAACAEPRDLPARWCCGERYELSARRALDMCTCFCCVQTAFYHCGAGGEDNQCYDQPCACGGAKCCSRWTCLAAAALLLPCLWCYWPMRGCLAATTSCYNRCRKKGCQCSKRPVAADKMASHSQTRRLLIESDSSSA